MPRKPGTYRDITIHVPLSVWQKVEAQAKRERTRPATLALAVIVLYVDHKAEERRLKRREQLEARQLAAPTGDLENDGDTTTPRNPKEIH